MFVKQREKASTLGGKVYKYFITCLNTERIQVCKNSLVKTLPVGRKTVERIAPTALAGIPVPDGLGKKHPTRDRKKQMILSKIILIVLQQLSRTTGVIIARKLIWKIVLT